MTPLAAFWMLLSLVVGALLVRRSQRTLGLSADQKFGIGLGLFIGAMIGAKLPFALADWDAFVSGRAWLENGKTIVFGMVGGYLGVEIAKAYLGITIKTGDSYAVPVAVAVAIGRLSCFTAGCCHGRPTTLPWGVDFGDGLKRHPTQLYESLFHLTAAGILVVIARRGWFPRQRIKLYLLAYLVYRFLSEFIRPEPRLAGGLTGYQGACLVLIPVVGLLWYRDREPADPLDAGSPREESSPMPDSTDSALVAFYGGRGVDHRGRTLAAIQAFDHDQLESIHDFIQWLFPLREPSAYNSRAPLLTDADIRAFHERPALRDALRESFRVFLDFLGLAYDPETGRVVEATDPGAASRREVFAEPNHNWLRITRVLTSLRTLGLSDEAEAFYTDLEGRYERGSGITDDTFAYWASAAGRQA